LDVTVKEVAPAPGVTFWFEGDTDRIGAVPTWVRVTITGLNPLTVTVILATLCMTDMFSEKVDVIVPFPVPDEVTVHQDWSLEAVQAALDVTMKSKVPAVLATSWFEGVTFRVGAIVVNCRSLP
jgi:hypothetical protein